MTQLQPKISLDQAGVKDGEQILFKGKMGFNRLDKPFSMEEIRDRQKSGKDRLVTMPYYTVTVKDIEIVSGSPEFQDYYRRESRIYKDNDGRWSVNVDKKTTNNTPLPLFRDAIDENGNKVLDPNGKPIVEAFASKGGTFEKEIDVIISVGAFYTKQYDRMGKGLNFVYVPKPVYYSGGMIGTSVSGLESLGLSVDTDSIADTSDQQNVEQQNTTATQQNNNTNNQNTYQNPNFNNQPQGQGNQNQFNNQQGNNNYNANPQQNNAYGNQQDNNMFGNQQNNDYDPFATQNNAQSRYL